MPVAALLALAFMPSPTAWKDGAEFGVGRSVWFVQHAIARPPVRPTRPINSLRELSSAIDNCWEPPPLAMSRPGTEITVLFSFKQDGDILGKPRITFQTPGLSPAQRYAYFRSVAEMLDRCAPLPVTPALGAAIAGRPFTKRFIDSRNQRKAEL